MGQPKKLLRDIFSSIYKLNFAYITSFNIIKHVCTLNFLLLNINYNCPEFVFVQSPSILVRTVQKFQFKDGQII
jgi:hypothetical protein